MNLNMIKSDYQLAWPNTLYVKINKAKRVNLFKT